MRYEGEVTFTEKATLKFATMTYLEKHWAARHGSSGLLRAIILANIRDSIAALRALKGFRWSTQRPKTLPAVAWASRHAGRWA